MSDLSEIQNIKAEEFLAKEHLVELCEHSKICVAPYLTVSYPEGWKSIVEELINEIGHLKILLRYMHDEYGFLDIKFDFLGRNNEVLVWRAIDDARRLSLVSCSVCGSVIVGFKRRIGFQPLCNQCIKYAAHTGKTGTWLDQY